MKNFTRIILLTGLLVFLGLSAHAAGNSGSLPKQDWSFKGLFGTFDRTELRRGLQVYREVCAACHGLRLLRFEKLEGLGFTKEDIKVIASNYEVEGDLNSEGEPTTRPAEPKDHFVSPYPNETAARAANNGAYPPDQTLIVKARSGGADYIHALLTGYQDPPSGLNLSQGMYYNTVFSGNQIAMAPPLSEGLVEYPDGTPATVHQMAHDVTTFLAWASDPEAEERRQMGIMVLLYVLIFACIMYVLNRRLWKTVKG
tara:strand:- start:225 stop:992 length:768 start_codon:yes stop_codon:yes gene_type:complete